MVILTQDLAALKTAIVGEKVNDGFAVQKDSDFSLILVKSETQMTSEYTFIKQQDGIRVIVASQIMMGGSIMRLWDNWPEQFNFEMERLYKIKAAVERK